MSRRFPYHHCQALGCTEMVPPGATLCVHHLIAQVEEADMHFPEAESLCPDASQDSTTPTTPVTGDAGIHKESHE